MGADAKTLIERVRALPSDDRIALVEDVLDSLDHADPGIDRVWAREASDRARGGMIRREWGDDRGTVRATNVLGRIAILLS